MGLISLLLGDKTPQGIRLRLPGQEQEVGVQQEEQPLGVVFDAIITDRFEMGSRVTTNPIEDAEQISDHISRNPERVALDCIISNTPTGLIAAIQAIGQNRIAEAEAELQRIHDAGELFDLVTGFRVHESFAITSLIFNRDVSNGSVLEFSMICQEVQIVESQVIGVPERLLAGDVKNSASQNQKLGKQPTGAASEKASRGASLLLQVLEGITQ